LRLTPFSLEKAEDEPSTGDDISV